ncbi:hypothetical protein [Longispora urticae]
MITPILLRFSPRCGCEPAVLAWTRCGLLLAACADALVTTDPDGPAAHAASQAKDLAGQISYDIADACRQRTLRSTGFTVVAGLGIVAATVIWMPPVPAACAAGLLLAGCVARVALPGFAVLRVRRALAATDRDVDALLARIDGPPDWGWPVGWQVAETALVDARSAFLTAATQLNKSVCAVGLRPGHRSVAAHALPKLMDTITAALAVARPVRVARGTASWCSESWSRWPSVPGWCGGPSAWPRPITNEPAPSTTPAAPSTGSCPVSSWCWHSGPAGPCSSGSAAQTRSTTRARPRRGTRRARVPASGELPAN